MGLATCRGVKWSRPAVVVVTIERTIGKAAVAVDSLEGCKCGRVDRSKGKRDCGHSAHTWWSIAEI